MNRKSRTSLIILALWLLMFSASSQFFIITPILTIIGDQLAIPESLRGTLISGYALSLGFFALVVGPFSDRIGRRRILIVGSALMSVALFAHTLAFDYWSMLGIRIVAGLAGGVLTGACVAYVSDYFRPDRRGWANGLIFTGSAAGQIAGIPIGTILADNLGFMSPFVVFGITMVVACFLVIGFVPQPQVRSSRKLGFRGSTRFYWKLLEHPLVRAVSASYFFMFLSIMGFVVYFPTWLETDFGYSSYQVAFIFLLGGIAAAIAGPVSGRLSDLFGRQQVIHFSNIALALVMMSSVFIINIAGFLVPVVFFLVMLLISSRMVPFQVLTTEIIPGSSKGRLLSERSHPSGHDFSLRLRRHHCRKCECVRAVVVCWPCGWSTDLCRVLVRDASRFSALGCAGSSIRSVNLVPGRARRVPVEVISFYQLSWQPNTS